MEVIEDRGPCLPCLRSPSLMIADTLYQKYSSSQNFFYTREIDELLGEELTQAAVALLEWQVLDDQDEFLKRQYRLDQYNGKSKSLGAYYQYHRELPRFFGMPIEATMKRYNDKIRDYEYKVVKRMMNETQESLFDPSLLASQTECSKSNMSNVLEELKESEIKMEESAAFLHVVNELKNLTKGLTDVLDLKADYFGSSSARRFQIYLQRIIKKKSKAQYSTVSIDKKPPLFRKEHGGQTSAKQSQTAEYGSQNSKFKSKLSERVDTLLNGLERTKPMLKRAPGIPLRMTKIQRGRSIEKIYGTIDRNLPNRQSLKFITLDNERPKQREIFKLYESKKDNANRQSTQVKTIDFRSGSNSASKKQFRVSLKQEEVYNIANTTRRKQNDSLSKMTARKKSESVPNIKQARTAVGSKTKAGKLDPIKIYKKIKEMV